MSRPSYSFVLHRERSGRLSVRARVRIDGRAHDTGTGVTVSSPSEWDRRRQRLKATSDAAAVSNLILTAVEGALSDLITRAAVERRRPSPDEARSAVMEAAGRATPPESDTADFFAVWDIFTSEAGRTNSWTERTSQKFASLRRHLEAYNPRLRLDTLTASDLQGFTEHLAARGLRNTTIAKLAEHVRWFLRWAAGAGYYGGTLHQYYRPKLKGSRYEQKAVVYLTIEELTRLETFDLTARPDLAAVRDVFVFCCYSGLRFSDAHALKATDIHGGCIHVVTKKTDDPLTIELNAHTRAILERWSGVPDGGRALPAISNVRTNLHLKELGRLVGLDTPIHNVYFKGSRRYDETRPKWQLLTTHAARRTFVVTALTLGIPAEVIIRWTGHSDYKAMKPYIAIVDEVKRAQMAVFDRLTAPAPPSAPPLLTADKEKGGTDDVAEPPVSG